MKVFRRKTYPFTSIVNQHKMKKGLILNAINPKIGGILICGEKGTAKSTAARALANLLPEIYVVEGCSFNCNPKDIDNLCDECKKRLEQGEYLKKKLQKIQVVELPVSSGEDRVVGSLDLEYAIKHGKCKFEPGILAKANRGIIYVDEVNLLDDHIVDLILDAAAMGINIVERENISYCHEANFILIGTMNPEEGHLRPQFLDRFGLCVEVEGAKDAHERVEIIKRREEFDNNPIEFIKKWNDKEDKLRKKIIKAREILPKVNISESSIKLISKLCVEAFVAGHRADIIMEKTACTIAAWHGREYVKDEDIYEAAELALYHRTGQESSNQDSSKDEINEENSTENNNQDKEKNSEKKPQKKKDESNNNNKNSKAKGNEKENLKEHHKQNEDNSSYSGEKEFVFSIGQPFKVKPIESSKDRIFRKGSGRRSNTQTPSKVGRYIKSTIDRNNDLALDATLRAAAPYQLYRRKSEVAVAIEQSDIRCKLREKKIGNLLIFVVDASGSMGAENRMIETKGAILSLLMDAYQKRDKIGMIAFKGSQAEVILPPTNSVELAHKLLQEMPTGGKTPLSKGLNKAYEVAKTELFKNPNILPMLIVISDGKGNVSMTSDKPLSEAHKIAEIIREENRINSLVIDIEKKNLISFDLAKDLSEKLGAKYYKVDEIKSDTLVNAIRSSIKLGI